MVSLILQNYLNYLISEDKNTYIQVSTVKDIPSKIKLTLEKIKDSKLEEINNLKNIKFFVLNNESLDKVKDYTGDDKIGNISFIKANDLITTRDILQKATTDLDFQINLYYLLKQETENIKDNKTQNQMQQQVQTKKVAVRASKKSGQYYTPDHPSYNQVAPKNIVIFNSEEAATKAGYKKAA